MKLLQAGAKAPSFSLRDQNGDVVKLKDFEGKKVLVYFYPRAMTPGCTVQACGLRDSQRELKRRGLVVLGISPDPVARLKKFEDKHQLNFKLLSDEDHAVADKFGVWGPKSFMGRKFQGIHRISFLIDEQGKVEHVFDDFKTKDHHELVLKYLE
jgi:peroxiredoxin Q/BCP